MHVFNSEWITLELIKLTFIKLETGHNWSLLNLLCEIDPCSIKFQMYNKHTIAQSIWSMGGVFKVDVAYAFISKTRLR